MLNVVMLSVTNRLFMLSVSVFILNVVLVNVMAPLHLLRSLASLS
jgi:hypothetical protein